MFVKPASGWTNMTETAKLTSRDAKCYYFGDSLAISGRTVVVGCPAARLPNLNQGAAYVFVKPMKGWETTSRYTARLTASDGQGFDELGTGVAVAGDTIAAGAIQWDRGPGAV